MYIYDLGTSELGRMDKRGARDRRGVGGFCTIGVAAFGMWSVLESIAGRLARVSSSLVNNRYHLCRIFGKRD